MLYLKRLNRWCAWMCCAGALLIGASAAVAAETVKEIAPGVLFEKNVLVPMRDGSSLLANVYRPKEPGTYPVIMSLSAYSKDLHTKAIHGGAWDKMLDRIPGLLDNSSGLYHGWELLDPEVWVPYGYVLVRVDSRGSGKSPGILSPFSVQEIEDYYDAIEWAGVQSWSNAKVGMAGISYYAIIQWPVAALQPPHLTAFIPWEGASDTYRDFTRHGGILNNVFPKLVWARQVGPIQHGNLDTPFMDTDDSSSHIGGTVAMTKAELEANSVFAMNMGALHPLIDEFYQERTADFSKITAPFLSSANWGGLGMHLRGNVEGFLNAASEQKWLEVHGSTHYLPFFSVEGQALQKEFFDHFLKSEDNGWDKRPPILLGIRHPGEKFVPREENEWPLARTEWRKLPLDASAMRLGGEKSTAEASVSYEAPKGEIRFDTQPFEETTEITGPLAANLWVSSSTADMDIFATLQLFDPEGKEVTFEGASEEAVPISQGWLRVSQRKLDPDKSTPERPYHSHDEAQPLEPGKIYEVQVEIWPTSIVVPKGYTLTLLIEGRDFSRGPGGSGLLTGSGPFLHNDRSDRPIALFGGTNTLHTGGNHESYLLIPVIPRS